MVSISIVMPLYNAEKYLAECLDSIRAQSFDDFELICVNDCSDDRTMDIVRQYYRKDSRIKILSNSEHRGAAFSRNKGMEKACGEYLMFLDGDDIFDEDLLLLAYNKASESQADIAVYQSVYVKSDNIYLKQKHYPDSDFIRKYCCHTFSLSSLKPYEYLNYQSTPWDKIYRREFILKENIKFQNLSCCNDVYFVNMALLMADKVIWLETEKILVYARMHSTPSRISYKRDPMCQYYADKKLLEEVLEKGKMPFLFRQCYTKIYFQLCWTLKFCKDSDSAKRLYDFLQKEGINKLEEFGGKYFDDIDIYIKNGFRKFQTESYKTEWFKKEEKIHVYLYDNAEKIQALFKKWETDKKKIALWGIDNNARCFLEFCYYNQLNIHYLLDRDKEKQGKRILDFPFITSPQSIIEKVQVFLFTKGSVLSDAEKILANKKIKAELLDISQKFI